MKKLIFTATLLITVIFIPFLAFSDGIKNEVKIIKSTLTKTTAIPNDMFENPQFKFEDGVEYSDQNDMEFRVCG